MILNSQGKVYYGMHFCPGVAQYDNAEGSFKVFINEATIRKMNPSFQARPVFVEHVDEIEGKTLEELKSEQIRNEADGWVVESFFNEADGKTWAKFIVVTEKGFDAIRKGFRLSNAYIPELQNKVGVWNGVTYQKDVTGGEFEHLAIVQNPRYDESVIMTPDEFKAYNENLKVELKRLSNSKTTNKENTSMGLKIFKRKTEKVENSADIEGMVVELPLSKKEVTISNALSAYDKILNMNGYANGDHMVKVGDKDEMSVNDLVKKHMDVSNELAEMKKNAAGEDGGEPGPGEEGDGVDNEVLDINQMGDVGDRGGDKHLANEEGEDEGGEDEAEAEAKKKKDKMKNDAAAKVKADAKKKADALKNANLRNSMDGFEDMRVDLAEDQVRRGQELYGSGK